MEASAQMQSNTVFEKTNDENNTVTQEDDNAKQMNILNVDVTNENVALNLLVSFVNLAQKRGAFNINESAKIWECIQRFQRAPTSS